MKYTKEEKEFAYKYLQEFRGKPLLRAINSVSRSGISRRIEFYSIGTDGEFDRIGYYIARIIGWPYSIDKGGISVTGCGMDMVYHTISNFNYSMCALDNPGMDFKERQAKFGRIYDTYFFDGNRISS